MHANVMIWGDALDSKSDGPLRLHWAVNGDNSHAKESDKYELAESSYDPPAMFVADLNDGRLCAFSNQPKGAWTGERCDAQSSRATHCVSSNLPEGTSRIAVLQ